MPLFQNAHVKNYRGLTDFEVTEFRDVNVVGGFNGVGKSTLLEALFLLIDQNNPTVMLRPFLWRNLPVSIDESTRMSWTDGNTEKIASISSKTNKGVCALSFKVEPQPIFPVQGNIFPHSQNTVAGTGVTMTCTLDAATRYVVHMKGSNVNEFQAWPEANSFPISLGKAVMLSRRTIDHPTELAQRYSTAVTDRRRKRILNLARAISPNINEIMLLQLGGQPSLFVSFQDNEDALLPISMLGDGLSAILSAGLAIIDCAGGAVFFDEFDGAIHYSKLTEIWAELIKLANELDVQIFAATHSKEAIKSISDASKDAKLTDKFLYIRIDKLNNEIKSTQYLQNELEAALADNWEVR